MGIPMNHLATPIRVPSLECRWFLDGPLPPAVLEAFLSVQPWHRPICISQPAWPVPWRVDAYLRIEAGHDVGIKLRDAAADPDAQRFEIKVAIGPTRTAQLRDQASGYLERWVKWSYPRGAVGRSFLDSFGLEGPAGVRVQKRRVQRVVHLDDHELREVDPGSSASPIVGCELTEVQVGEVRAWSLGFESPLTQEVRPATFERAARALVDALALELPLDRSLSYPAWLSDLAP
jgi:hypothetical protein